MQARDLLAADYHPRDAVFAARDRCDETVDHLRAVRTERFKYIRNYLSERPHLQPNVYKDGKLIVQRLRELHAAGQPLARCALTWPAVATEARPVVVKAPAQSKVRRARQPICHWC